MAGSAIGGMAGTIVGDGDGDGDDPTGVILSGAWLPLGGNEVPGYYAGGPPSFALSTGGIPYVGLRALVAGGVNSPAVFSGMVARWDGGDWEELDTDGLAMTSFVGVAVSADEQLFAGGDDRYARFDGASWQALPDLPEGFIISDAEYYPVMKGASAGSFYTILSDGTDNYVFRYHAQSWGLMGGGPFLADDINASLAVGPDDAPYVAYLKDSNYEIARASGGMWEVLGDTGVIAGDGYGVRLQIAPDAAPYFLYETDLGTDYAEVFVIRFVDGIWEQVGEPVAVYRNARRSGLAIDATWVPLIGVGVNLGTELDPIAYATVYWFDGDVWNDVGYFQHGTMDQEIFLEVSAAGNMYVAGEGTSEQQTIGEGMTVKVYQ